MPSKQHWIKLGLLLLILVAIFAFFHYDLGASLNLDNLKSQRAELSAYVDANIWTAIAIYFVVYVLVAALSLPGAAILTLAGGAIFGLLTGLVVVSFASSIGALLAFLSSRFLFRDFVMSRFGSRLSAIESGIEKDGAFYLLTLRLVPVFPFVLVNLVMGLTSIKARTFYLFSQIGMLPGTLAFVYAGTQLARIESPKDVLSPGLITAFVILGILPISMRKLLQWFQERKNAAV